MLTDKELETNVSKIEFKCINFGEKNAFENVVYKMMAIFSGHNVLTLPVLRL